MSGYIRGLHRQALPRKEVAAIAAHFVAEETAAFENASRDPFAIAHDCLNPVGHYFVASCGAVACVHCAKVAWL